MFVLALATSLLALLVFAVGADANIALPVAGPTENAQATKGLYLIVLIIALVIFVGVEGALVYAFFRFRAKRHPVAAQLHGNTPLEISWTVIPALILVAIAVVTFVKLDAIRNPLNCGPKGLPSICGSSASGNTVLTADTEKRLPPNGRSLNIQVNGQQYIWRFTYPKKQFGTLYSYEEMVVPIDTTVTLDITSQDVDHSWWVPALGGKFDAIPGYTNHTWFKITKPGVYHGQCAELCGRNHANMVADVKAVTIPQFEAWVRQQKAGIKQAQNSIQNIRGRLAQGGFQPKQAADAEVPTTPAQQSTP